MSPYKAVYHLGRPVCWSRYCRLWLL